MAHWLVTQGDHQFRVADLDALKQLASEGGLGPGDMVQPPGATDWLYATEIPELAGQFGDDGEALEDAEYQKGPSRNFKLALYGALVLFAIGAGLMFYWYKQLPTGEEALLGEGGTLSYSEMLVKSDGARLYSDPDASSSTKATLEKDQVLELLAKRGDFYNARTEQGTEGWVKYDEVVPMYLLGGGDVREEYDPLYNPDRYCNVRNASWLALDEENRNITVFNFYLFNEAKYEMTDLVIRATIKDSRGNVLEQVEIPVEGIVPAQTDTFVGMLFPEGFEDMPRDEARDKAQVLTQHTFGLLRQMDPDANLRYLEGVEVEMSTGEFTEANIEVVELRAIPPE